jgi:hypothetical protein
MSDLAFFGMRTTGNWDLTTPNTTSTTNELKRRPENWREAILMLDPNGESPLTAMLSKMANEKVDDPTFHWFQRAYPAQNATITDTYTTSALSEAYATNDTAAAGTTVYVKMSEADAYKFRSRETVQFVDEDQHGVNFRGVVTSRVIDGASSYVAVKLIQAATAVNTNYGIGTANKLEIIGTAQEEGAGAPDSVVYDPTEYYNYTQIFEESVDLSRTALQTRLRTGDPYKDAKTMALLTLGKKMEFAALFGYRYIDTGTNGKPRRFTGGIEWFIEKYASDNISSFEIDGGAGTTFATGGKVWLDEYLEKVFRTGSQERIAYCGSGALQGIADLAYAKGEYTITPMQNMAFGIKVATWDTPHGTVYLKKHPLFQYNERNRYRMMIVDPKLIKVKKLQEVFFKEDVAGYKKGGQSAVDGVFESFLGEFGFEIHHADCFADLHGVGKDGPN